MKNVTLMVALILLGCFTNGYAYQQEGLSLYYWRKKHDGENFGDYLSLKLVERIVGGQVVVANKNVQPKLLAIGSILSFAREGDVIWGTGVKIKNIVDRSDYSFNNLDVRAVRGPLTKAFLEAHWKIRCPEVYGDPALLIPYFFPEFKKQINPKYDYMIVPHYSDVNLFPKHLYPNVVYPTEPYADVIRKILNSKFVISSSLHGIIVAEAYGIPARYIRVSEKEPLFKYIDYYLGTNRPHFTYATSIEEALQMGGELPFECDLEKLYQSFPFEYWPHAHFKKTLRR